MSRKELMQQQGLLGTNEVFFSLFSHIVFHCVYKLHNSLSFILVLIGSPPILLLSPKRSVELGLITATGLHH